MRWVGICWTPIASKFKLTHYPQDYAEAAKWYRVAADNNVDGAQNNLGLLYEHGRGVPQDYAEAMKWYLKAAVQGDADAQTNLGNMYWTAHGGPQNYSEAAKWYRKAAVQGDANAETMLGVMSDKGRGVAQDYAEAVKWYRLAAEQGNAQAQFNLGVSFHNGEGVPKDYAVAYMWFNLSAAQGDTNAAKWRDLTGRVMTPYQLGDAQRMTRDWKPDFSRDGTLAPSSNQPSGAEAQPPIDYGNDTPYVPPASSPTVVETPQPPASADGATIKVGKTTGNNGQELTVISVEGELVAGDEKRFADAAVRATSGTMVVLNSPGGNMLAGIQIGKDIRLEGFDTAVPQGLQCASACAFAWLGGTRRFMAEGATVGFHAVYTTDNGQDTVSSAGNAVVGGYLSTLGLSMQAITYITEKQPADIQWLTFDDAAQLGIEVSKLPPG